MSSTNDFSPESFFDLKDFSHPELFDGCETVWEVLPRIKEWLEGQKLGEIETEIPEGAVLVDREKISIGKGTVVEPGCYIKGPCKIGKNGSIRQGAYLRGNVVAGEGCVIGHATEVKNALFLNGAKAAHFAYVGDSILGNGVNLGAGTKCANLKFDGGPVTVYYEGGRVETALRKFGAIFGDYSQTGCNAVTNPGTILGKRAACFPCSSVRGLIPAGKIFK